MAILGFMQLKTLLKGSNFNNVPLPMIYLKSERLIVLSYQIFIHVCINTFTSKISNTDRYRTMDLQIIFKF